MSADSAAFTCRFDKCTAAYPLEFNEHERAQCKHDCRVAKYSAEIACKNAQASCYDACPFGGDDALCFKECDDVHTECVDTTEDAMCTTACDELGPDCIDCYDIARADLSDPENLPLYYFTMLGIEPPQRTGFSGEG